MNTLEQLTAENRENYEVYLERMAKSCMTSTKRFIPFYTYGCNKILDVGCADGSLMEAIKEVNPTATIMGIDLNKNAVIEARKKGLKVYNSSLEEVGDWTKQHGRFDCIIFSSVLHEVSSYAKDWEFTALPVKEILTLANELLAYGGRIIIRDGLEDENWGFAHSCHLKFSNVIGIEWFKRFVNETHFKYNYRYHISGNHVFAGEKLAQEFLATYTWGAESWNREIKEKFCIFTEAEWIRIIEETGFEIKQFMKSKEQYPEYLLPKVQITDDFGRECFPFMTCTIVAQKKGEF